MAEITVEEGPSGLKRRKFRGAKWCESAADAQVGPAGAPRGLETPDCVPGPDRPTGKACESAVDSQVELEGTRNH